MRISVTDLSLRVIDMFITTSPTQPKEETDAITLFHQMGREKVFARYDEISQIAQRRYHDSLQRHRTIPVGYTALNFMTAEELAERHILMLAMMLCVDEQTEARERIRKRLALRKLRSSAPVNF